MRELLGGNLRLDTWEIAELFLLNAYLQQKNMLSGLELAQTCHQLGRLYLELIRHLTEAVLPLNGDKSKRSDKRAYLYFDLHLAAKRFLAVANQIVYDEGSQQERRGRIRCDISADLCELLLKRGRILELLKDENPGHFVEIFQSCQIDSASLRDYFGERTSEIADHRLADVSRECLRYARETVQSIVEEIENHTTQYRLASEVFYRHGNLMDRELQFDLASRIRRRFNPAIEEMDSESYDRFLLDLRARLADALTIPVPMESWEAGVTRLLDTVNPFLL